MTEKPNDTAPDHPLEVEDEGEILQWTTHPLRRKPLVAVIVTVFILIIGLLVYMTTGSKLFGTLALIVLFASLAKFYLPTRYKLSDRCVTIKTTTQTINKDWSQFRSFYPDKNGVLLSPFIQPSRLENFRGIYLIFGSNKDEVVRFVREHVKSEVEPQAAGGDDE